MKKNMIKCGALLLFAVALTLVAVLPMQRGDTDRSTWMASLNDEAPLNSLTLPGTHDSGRSTLLPKFRANANLFPSRSS